MKKTQVHLIILYFIFTTLSGMEIPEEVRPQTYYEILGVKEDATLQAITKAYRKATLLYHSDRVELKLKGQLDSKKITQEEYVQQLKDAREKWNQLQNAYDVLSDEKKRKGYDITGKIPVKFTAILDDHIKSELKLDEKNNLIGRYRELNDEDVGQAIGEYTKDFQGIDETTIMLNDYGVKASGLANILENKKQPPFVTERLAEIPKSFQEEIQKKSFEAAFKKYYEFTFLDQKLRENVLNNYLNQATKLVNAGKIIEAQELANNLDTLLNTTWKNFPVNPQFNTMLAELMSKFRQPVRTEPVSDLRTLSKSLVDLNIKLTNLTSQLNLLK